MKKTTKILILLFVGFVLIKSILSFFIPAPSAFSDEYHYAKIARSFYHFLSFDIHGIPIHQHWPLYSVLVSVSYVFKDMTLVYIFIKVINAILSSLIIFPAFLLAKEFFNEKKAILISILVSVLPGSFSFSPYILSENLFYPLALFSFYFVYKSFTKKEIHWDVLAGLFIGLSFLTKPLILPIILAIFIVFLYKLAIRDYFEVKKKAIMALFFVITVLPWIIRNMVLFGPNFGGLFGTYSETNTSFQLVYLLSLISLIFVYLGYLWIASGFVLPLTLIPDKDSFRRNRIFFVLLFATLFSFLIFMGYRQMWPYPEFNLKTILPWLAVRPIGRYVSFLIPLIFIGGLINYGKIKNFKFRIFFSLIVLFFGSYVLFFPMFPTNDMELSHLGILDYIISFLIKSIWIKYAILFSALLILLSLAYYMTRKLDFNKLIYVMISFFLLLSLMNYGLIYYNSKTYWYEGEQMQLGLWINDNIPYNMKFVFDERDCENRVLKLDQKSICEKSTENHEIDQPITIIGVWMNQDIEIGDVNGNYDYIITRHNLDYELIKESESGIKVYKK